MAATKKMWSRRAIETLMSIRGVVSTFGWIKQIIIEPPHPAKTTLFLIGVYILAMVLPFPNFEMYTTLLTPSVVILAWYHTFSMWMYQNEDVSSDDFCGWYVYFYGLPFVIAIAFLCYGFAGYVGKAPKEIVIKNSANACYVENIKERVADRKTLRVNIHDHLESLEFCSESMAEYRKAIGVN